MPDFPLITKIYLHNFRSIKDETVDLNNPLILVGRNSAGKSNFIHSLTFLSDCMQIPIETIVNREGHSLFYREFDKNGKQRNYASVLSIRVDITFSENTKGHYLLTYGNK